MATPLPDLSDYNVNVTPYQGLKEISRTFGAGAGFGDADYIGARQAGYTDAQIVSFLKANPYLDTGKVSDAIQAGQQDQIIAGGLPNLNKSDPNRKALVDPNASTSTKVPYADYTVAGRGGAPSVQMSNANVNVAGNDSYNQLMNASQSGSLLMVKNPPQNNLFGQSYDPGTYKLIDSYTGDVVANNVSPSQTKGVYQFNFANPQSEGSVNAYIRADPTTGAVGAIDPSKNLSYQSGMGGGMLSGIAGMALPILGTIAGAALGLPSLGELVSSLTDAGTVADFAANAGLDATVGTADAITNSGLVTDAMLGGAPSADIGLSSLVNAAGGDNAANAANFIGSAPATSAGGSLADAANQAVAAAPTGVTTVAPAPDVLADSGATATGLDQAAAPPTNTIIPSTDSSTVNALAKNQVSALNNIVPSTPSPSPDVISQTDYSPAASAPSSNTGVQIPSSFNNPISSLSDLANQTVSPPGLDGSAGVGVSPSVTATIPEASTYTPADLSTLAPNAPAPGLTTPVASVDTNLASPMDIASSSTTPGNPGINLNQSAVPNLPSMGGGQGLTVPSVDAAGNPVTISQAAVVPATAAPSLGSPTSMVNNPSNLPTGSTPSTTLPTSALSNLAKIAGTLAAGAGIASIADPSVLPDVTEKAPTLQTLNWNYKAPAPHPYGEVMGQQYLNPVFTPVSKAEGGLTSIPRYSMGGMPTSVSNQAVMPTTMYNQGVPAFNGQQGSVVNSPDRYPTDEEAKEAFNSAFPEPHYEQTQTNPYLQSLHDLMVQMHMLPDDRVGMVSPESQNMAMGKGHYVHGGEVYSLGSYSDGGRLLKGPGDGMSDNIPATIGHNQPARLAEGEFVIPADVVSHLGNGSTEAGSKVLYGMMERVRKARTGNPKQGKQIKANKFMPA